MRQSGVEAVAFSEEEEEGEGRSPYGPHADDLLFRTTRVLLIHAFIYLAPVRFIQFRVQEY